MSETTEGPSVKEKVIAWSLRPVAWVLMHTFKLHRLKVVDKAPLEAPIEDAFSLYGEPYETSTHDRCSDAKVHRFSLGPFHDVNVTEWQGLIHGVSFWPARGSPTKDLKNVMNSYGDGMKWIVLDRGYSYLREDRKYRIFCSAMPAIGIVTVAFTESSQDIRNSEAGELDDNVDNA